MKAQLVSTLSIVVALAASPGWSNGITGGYASAVVFGDSLSDTGRVKETLEALTGGAISYPPAPYNDGRFTGGDNYVDVLQDMWGLTSDVDLLNYAFGGAKAVRELDIVLDLGEQVTEYRNDGAPGAPGALGIVNFGGNDAIGAAYAAGGNSETGEIGIAEDESDPAKVAAARQSARQAGRYAANAIKYQIRQLSNSGMNAFLLFNLADVGETPRFNDPNNLLGLNPLTGQSNGKYATMATNAFNRRLGIHADFLRDLGLDIFEVDAAGRAADILANPEDYGLADASGACGEYDQTDGLGLNYYDFSSATCDETDIAGIDVPYWDDVHPNQILHEQYALAADEALLAELGPLASSQPLNSGGSVPPVPLPGSLAGLVAGLMALAGVRRRRASA